ncbi:hypothetical protein C7974DRAFT_93751 [Boeremia exigua]|uniref:uncharacterized protein n=1 Tax=Boeremia exigua TaxID=749465 RepID=UPI001E8EAC1E|nr:uncharacterized protein C7974DRAFT_93751 [Boeremia exigua]KAH6642022.1 hypothetical protein C7974DRAFT_93751 [Boeremia exigua]
MSKIKHLVSKKPAAVPPHVPERIFDPEKDLKDILVDFQSDYESIANVRLDRNRSFEAIRDDMEKSLDEHRVENCQRSKKVLRNIGTCLMKFGEIAAGGASIAFPATTPCWNVVNVIVKSIQQNQEVLDGFIYLMERSSAFLGRLNDHLAEHPDNTGDILPKSLREPAYRILHLFLGTLMASYLVFQRGTWSSLKRYMKIVLFNEDHGVAEKLTDMEESIRDFVETQINQILIDVRGIARYCTSLEEIKKNEKEVLDYVREIFSHTGEMANVLQQMKETSERLANEKQNAENLSKIRRSFSLGSGDDESWKKRHDEVGRVNVPLTGQWLRSEYQFEEWSDTANQNTKVLMLQAEPGYGKTHLIYSVIQHLRTRYNNDNQSSAPVHIAYYYFNDEKDESLERCVGSIIYQFAKTDNRYATAVAAAFKKETNVIKAQERWTNLVSGQAPAMKGTYFVCIDGYDPRVRSVLSDSTINDMAGCSSTLASKGISLRLMIAGTENILPDASKSQPGIGQISLDAGRSQDLSVVLQDNIDRTIAARPEFKEVLNDSNVKKLITDVKDYSLLNMKMAQISMCNSEEEVQAVIDTTGTTWNSLLRDKIHTLYRSLTPAQTDTLNEILKWIVGTQKTRNRSYIAVDILEGVLLLKLNQKMFLNAIISRIYPRLLKVDEQDDVLLRSDDYFEILCTKDKERLESEITVPEIEMCSRIVAHACGPIDFARFSFEKFFKELIGNQKSEVLVEANDAQIAILTSCVNVFQAPLQDALEPLEDYSAYWFYEHLKTLMDGIDPHYLENRHIAEIGSRLVDLFYEPDCINRWFKDNRIASLRADWIDKDSFIDALLSFWRSSYAVKGVTSTDERTDEKHVWAMSFLAESGDKIQVLEKISVQLAIRWFNCEEQFEEETLWFPWAFFKKITHQFIEDDQPSLQQVDDFIQWAVNSTKLDPTTPVWLFCKGKTFVQFDYDQRGAELLREAIVNSSDNRWLYLEALYVHRRLEDYQSSLDYARKLKSLYETLQDSDEYREIYVTEVLLPQIEDHMKLKEWGSAAQCCREFMHSNPWSASGSYVLDGVPNNTLDTLEKLFECLHRMNDHGAIIDQLEAWRTLTDDEGLLYWFELVADSTKVQQYVIAAAKHTDKVNTVHKMILQVQKATESKALLGSLRYFEAALLIFGSKVDTRYSEGIVIWEQIMEPRSRMQISELTVERTAHALSTVLLDNALLEPSKPAPHQTSGGFSRRLLRLRQNDLGNDVFFDNPHICLIRLHAARKDMSAARREAKERLFTVFNDWPDETYDGSLATRFLGLAKTLTVLDDDENAIAAWQALKPRTEVVDPESDSNETPPTYLDDRFNFTCDGCGAHRVGFVECWVCKHCPDLQLCIQCEQDLRQDHLPPTICNKDHTLLYLPPINLDAVKELSPDQTLCGGRGVSRAEWIANLRDKYEVQQDQIEMWMQEKARRMRAARFLIQFLKWRMRARKKKNASEIISA